MPSVHVLAANHAFLQHGIQIHPAVLQMLGQELHHNKNPFSNHAHHTSEQETDTVCVPAET